MSVQYVSKRLSDLKTLKSQLALIECGIADKDKSFGLNVRLRGSGDFTTITIDREIVIEWLDSQKRKLEKEIKSLSDAIDHCAETLGYEKPDTNTF